MPRPSSRWWVHAVGIACVAGCSRSSTKETRGDAAPDAQASAAAASASSASASASASAPAGPAELAEEPDEPPTGEPLPTVARAPRLDGSEITSQVVGRFVKWRPLTIETLDGEGPTLVELGGPPGPRPSNLRQGDGIAATLVSNGPVRDMLHTLQRLHAVPTTIQDRREDDITDGTGVGVTIRYVDVPVAPYRRAGLLARFWNSEHSVDVYNDGTVGCRFMRQYSTVKTPSGDLEALRKDLRTVAWKKSGGAAMSRALLFLEDGVRTAPAATLDALPAEITKTLDRLERQCRASVVRVVAFKSKQRAVPWRYTAFDLAAAAQHRDNPKQAQRLPPELRGAASGLIVESKQLFYEFTVGDGCVKDTGTWECAGAASLDASEEPAAGVAARFARRGGAHYFVWPKDLALTLASASPAGIPIAADDYAKNAAFYEMLEDAAGIVREGDAFYTDVVVRARKR